MQVKVDMKCMETNFGRHCLSCFGDCAAKFPMQNMVVEKISSTVPCILMICHFFAAASDIKFVITHKLLFHFLS